jgi:hypothetical protein
MREALQDLDLRLFEVSFATEFSQALSAWLYSLERAYGKEIGGRVMKYFVTGTTGFVGGHVARQLVEAGHEVVAVVRNPAKAGDLKNLSVQVYQGDVTEKESMRGPMSVVDGRVT